MSEELDDIVENLSKPSSWIRIIFMVGFALLLYLLIAPIILALMVIQALFSVIGGEPNSNLRRFGKALTDYVAQILLYLSYNQQDKPFPFSDFPAMPDAEAGTRGGGRSTAGAKKSARKKSGRTSAGRAPAKKPATKKSQAGVDSQPDTNNDAGGR